MGFWHTGYIEFHESAGLGDYVPVPPVYRCKQCEEVFTTSEELSAHRFENHPYIRPILFLRGIEVGTTAVRITRPLVTEDIHTGRWEQAWLNGVQLSQAELVEKLVGGINDTVTLRLANEGVASEFTLRFAIANEEDLEGVDNCLLDVAQKGRLDKRAIEDFIVASESFPTAIGYCNGICEYFYGVLAKEGSPDSSLPYEQYREKFTRAGDALKDFNRPLARVMGALIAFHFNHFTESIDLAGKSRVGIASGRFERWMAGDVAGAVRVLSYASDCKIEKLLTDVDTEKFIGWSVSMPKALMPQLQDIESLIHKNISEFDRTKLHILLAELYVEQGKREEAKRHARELRNNPTFGPWAESVFDRLTVEEK